ncbi:hypothetical protein JS55_07915 (plasmid) [Rickettsia felis str. LSU]|nr:DnaA N-terminal domain-containing protein [Rickettsia felis]KHO02177.1 hypothetical protein JS55_07915 [Rickettsia felis str. LSU]
MYQIIKVHVDHYYQRTLSERQIATLSEQLEAVYGINGYYVTVLEGDVNPEDVEYAERSRGKKEIAIGVNNEMIYPKTAVFDNVENDTPIDIPASNSVVNTTNENTVWNQIRKGLREELGEAVDETWFSKAEAKECKETKTLTLTMPTRFMSDWVRNNYSHVIRGLSEGYKINYKFKEVFKCHY